MADAARRAADAWWALLDERQAEGLAAAEPADRPVRGRRRDLAAGLVLAMSVALTHPGARLRHAGWPSP